MSREYAVECSTYPVIYKYTSNRRSLSKRVNGRNVYFFDIVVTCEKKEATKGEIRGPRGRKPRLFCSLIIYRISQRCHVSRHPTGIPRAQRIRNARTTAAHPRTRVSPLFPTQRDRTIHPQPPLPLPLPPGHSASENTMRTFRSGGEDAFIMSLLSTTGPTSGPHLCARALPRVVSRFCEGGPRRD